MPKIFLIKNRLHQQQQKLLENQKGNAHVSSDPLVQSLQNYHSDNHHHGRLPSPPPSFLKPHYQHHHQPTPPPPPPAPIRQHLPPPPPTSPPTPSSPKPQPQSKVDQETPVPKASQGKAQSYIYTTTVRYIRHLGTKTRLLCYSSNNNNII